MVAGAPDATPRRGLVVDRRGAVFVEFLIVFSPLFAFFLTLVQLAFVTQAKLVVKLAADRAVRAAIVVLPDNDRASYGGIEENVLDGERYAAIRRAAKLSLLPLEPGSGGSIEGALDGARMASDVALRVALAGPGGTGPDDAILPVVPANAGEPFAPDQIVEVKVQYLYTCTVPIGRWLACRADLGLEPASRLTAKAWLPNQGATYVD